MKTQNQPVILMTIVAAACGIAAAQACEDGMLVDYGGQSCYEGWNDYQRAQPPQHLAVCPDWHDETPGALADHCPLVQAPPAPEIAPDWYDEAPRLLQAASPPQSDIVIEAMVPEIDEVTLMQRAIE